MVDGFSRDLAPRVFPGNLEKKSKTYRFWWSVSLSNSGKISEMYFLQKCPLLVTTGLSCWYLVKGL